jgi:tRNA 5-methylaminomethyl-2-thiouridine biosynthesis bifunctional protein
MSGFRADAVFFDPFAPDVNPDCWTADCFQWVMDHMSETAILATYSAQGKMRRSMAAAGLFVARGAGSGGKRESTLASPSEERLSPFPLKYRP